MLAVLDDPRLRDRGGRRVLKAVGEQRRALRGIRGQRSRAGGTGVAGGAGRRANRGTDGSKSRAEKRRRAWQGARTAQLNDRDVRSESTRRPAAASTATCPRTRSTTPVVGDHQPLQISRDVPLLYWCSLAAMAATASTACRSHGSSPRSNRRPSSLSVDPRNGPGAASVDLRPCCASRLWIDEGLPTRPDHDPTRPRGST